MQTRFNQWKIFSRNYKSMRVRSWVVYKIIENNCLLRHFTYFIQTQETQANIRLFKIINSNTRKRCEISSKLAVKTPGGRHWRRFFFLVGEIFIQQARQNSVVVALQVCSEYCENYKAVKAVAVTDFLINQFFAS